MPWDVIVVGAGIEGSAAAYTLAKQGTKTLLLEQFLLPHSRGSSHGHARITRMAYPEQFYTRMMADAFKLWKQLEHESAMTLYKKTGLLVVRERGSEALNDTEAAIRSTGQSSERLPGRSVQNKFPTMRFDDSFDALFDATGGILRADMCLQAFQTQFKKYGGVLQDGEGVESVRPAGDLVHVKTFKSQYDARNVIIAAGPWTSQLTRPLGLDLPLQVERVNVWYFKQLHSSAFGNEGCPVIVYDTGDGGHLYGFPVFEYPRCVKFGYHSGPVCDPDERDSPTVDNKVEQNHLSKFVAQHLSGIDPTPSITETCIYTVTPDRNFILDRHPKWKNIIIAAGFSGHGFKLAPAVGKLLAELTTGKQPTYDLKPFKIDRFSSQKLHAKL